MQSRKFEVNDFFSASSFSRVMILRLGVLVTSFTFLVILCVMIADASSSGRDKVRRFWRSLFQITQVVDDPLTVFALPMTAATLLLLVTSVTTVVVQIASTRFTPLISSVFLKNKYIILVLGFFIITEVYVLIASQTCTPLHRPGTVILIAFLLVGLSVIAILPYFAYLLQFLDPTRMMAGLLKDISSEMKTKLVFRKGGSDEDDYIAVTEARAHLSHRIELLSDLGLKAMQWRDGNVVGCSVETLVMVAFRSMGIKDSVPGAWFMLRGSIFARTVDFISLSDEAVINMERSQTWVEWKIFRQLLILYAEGLIKLKEVCSLISTLTLRIGIVAIVTMGDYPVAYLVQKMLNTYMRFSLNAKDTRTAFHVCDHQRQLAEAAVTVLSAFPERRRAVVPSVQGLVDGTAARFVLYGSIARTALPFLTSVAAHDLATMTIKALASEEEGTGLFCHVILDHVVDFLRGSGVPMIRGVALCAIRVAARLDKDRPYRLDQEYLDALEQEELSKAEAMAPNESPPPTPSFIPGSPVSPNRRKAKPTPKLPHRSRIVELLTLPANKKVLAGILATTSSIKKEFWEHSGRAGINLDYIDDEIERPFLKSLL